MDGRSNSFSFISSKSLPSTSKSVSTSCKSSLPYKWWISDKPSNSSGMSSSSLYFILNYTIIYLNKDSFVKINRYCKKIIETVKLNYLLLFSPRGGASPIEVPSRIFFIESTLWNYNIWKFPYLTYSTVIRK